MVKIDAGEDFSTGQRELYWSKIKLTANSVVFAMEPATWY